MKKTLNEKNLPIVPLTLQELHDAATQRISLIKDEFTQGFEFLMRYDRSVTVFGSARFVDGHPYYEKARSVCSRIVSELGYSVLTGGGPGIMEAANRAAFEAKGSSVGLTIKLPHEQATNPYLTDHLDLYYFFIRKVCLSFSAEAYIFFPGGFGSLDEFFEILTLVQTRKIQTVPIILVGSEYWKDLEHFLYKNLVDLGTIDLSDLQLYTITDDEDEIVDIIKRSPVRNGLKYSYESKQA
jgi:uncharacterized protein (TIGR00730 family)